MVHFDFPITPPPKKTETWETPQNSSFYV